MTQNTDPGLADHTAQKSLSADPKPPAQKTELKLSRLLFFISIAFLPFVTDFCGERAALGFPMAAVEYSFHSNAFEFSGIFPVQLVLNLFFMVSLYFLYIEACVKIQRSRAFHVGKNAVIFYHGVIWFAGLLFLLSPQNFALLTGLYAFPLLPWFFLVDDDIAFFAGYTKTWYVISNLVVFSIFYSLRRALNRGEKPSNH